MTKLFPPITQPSLPAFDKGKSLRFFYKPSPVNTIGQVQHIQLVLNYINKNASALQGQWKNVETMFIDVRSSNIENGWYYFDIPGNEFPQSNEAYKIQIRFSSAAKPSTPTNQWFLDNRPSFSEWSSVTVVMPIIPPTTGLQGMSEEIENTLNDNGYSFIGVYDSQETLQKYSIDVYTYTDFADRNSWRLLESSGDRRSGMYEETSINYTPKTNFIKEGKYIVVFKITTKNNFTIEKVYRFRMNESSLSSITTLSARLEGRDKDYGQVRLSLVALNPPSGVESIIVKRSSIATNFELWEHVTTIPTKTAFANIDIVDKGVEHGMMYIYGAQFVTRGGSRSPHKLSNPIIADYEDRFLIGENGRQLRLRFDTQVNNIRQNTRETRVDTLGSQFPFTIRNANLKYREFSISGLITHFMDGNQEFDNDNLFIDSDFRTKPLTKQVKDMYSAYYAQEGITPHSNRAHERRFRDEVMNFLQDGKPKLFKSPTEGLILVKLLDVSINPTQALAGLTGNFSATAIEVGPLTDEELMKHKIIK